MDAGELVVWFLFVVIVFGALALLVAWWRAGNFDVPAYVSNAPPLRPYVCSRTIMSKGGHCALCFQPAELHRSGRDYGEVIPFASCRSRDDAETLRAGELARHIVSHSRGLDGYVARVQSDGRWVFRAWLGPAESLQAGELCAEHPRMLGALRVLLGIVLRRSGAWNNAPADERAALSADAVKPTAPSPTSTSSRRRPKLVEPLSRP